MKPRLLTSLLTLLVLLVLPGQAHAFGFLAGPEGLDVLPVKEGGQLSTQAGSHPIALNLDLGFEEGGDSFPEGDLKDLRIELPPGLFENPTAVPQCSSSAFESPRDNQFEESLSGESCQDRAQVGTITLRSTYGGGETRTFGLFNLRPPPGFPSQFGANPYGAPIVFTPELRQAQGEYGITLVAKAIPQLLGIKGMSIRVWGNPWSVINDTQRGDCLNALEPDFGWSKCSIGRPLANPSIAYLTLPTSCEAPMAFKASVTSWQGGSDQRTALAHQEGNPKALGGCNLLPFEPDPWSQLRNPRASSPSGFDYNIDVDTSGVTNPSSLTPSPVRRALVSLPKGMTINPSVGAGLGVCRPAQYAAETALSPPGAGCPNESKVGDFTVMSPLFEERLEGSLFLAAPFDNPFGSLIAIYLVAKSSERGVLVKVAGRIDAEESTGQLTATFEDLPQLPYSRINVHFREGQRSPLATPAACGPIETVSRLTPWRNPGLVKVSSFPLQVTAGIGGGPCPSGLAPFNPTAKGGTLNSRAGAFSPFYLHLTRADTEQEITSYSATLPPGLFGKVAGIPFCPDAAIAVAATRSGVAERDNPSCPAASLIGKTIAGYGLGQVLSYAPGNLYLAGPYNGSQFSVVAIDAALVGPFDLGTVIVRSAIRVERHTGQVSIDATGTDPIPHIIEGIPVHLRDVRAYIDRPGVTLNPTSCNPFQVSSALNGAGERFADKSDDSLAIATSPFQAFDCASLGFKPRLSLKLIGATKRGAHPALRAEVRPRPGDANVAKAQVTLPPSLFLDQDSIETICTRVQYARDACPASSIYGKARAFTPLLDEPLEGPVYLRSSENPLPDVVFSLQARGFRIDLVGKIDSFKGGIRGTFDVIPDAPATRFVLKMRGGKRGILVSSARDLCREPQRARARMIGHNNLGRSWTPVVKAQCGGKKGKGRAKGRAERKGAGR